MQSPNFLQSAIALTAVRTLVNRMTLPALVPPVTKLLSHEKFSPISFSVLLIISLPLLSEYVRKKAVLALHAFYRCDPDSISGMDIILRRVFCDRSPSVMAATLGLYYDLVRVCCTHARVSYLSLTHTLTHTGEPWWQQGSC